MKSNTLTGRLCKLAVIVTLSAGLTSLTTVSAQTLYVAQADAEDSGQVANISQRRALELVRARFPGTVVSIKQVQQEGVLQYRVRMDNEGTIYTVFVNAQSGAITREQ